MPTIAELVSADRSVRRFAQTPVSAETLRDFVDIARLVHSGANHQPLRYALVASAEACDRVFPHTRWAAGLADWTGPAPDERPTAYIVICRDREGAIAGGLDHGIAAEAIALAATERGLSACMIGAFDGKGVSAALSLDERYQALLVIALGVAGETVVIETVGADGSTKYWRDEAGVHHVPKRALEDVIIATAP
jgi:nitroreductase